MVCIAAGISAVWNASVNRKTMKIWTDIVASPLPTRNTYTHGLKQTAKNHENFKNRFSNGKTHQQINKHKISAIT